MDRIDGIYELILVASDAYLQEQVRLTLGQRPQWRLRIEIDVDLPEDSDSLHPNAVFLIDVDSAIAARVLPHPVVIHGAPTALPLLATRDFDDFLAQPWTPDELVYRIERLARRRTIHCASGTIEWDRFWLAGNSSDRRFTRASISSMQSLILDVLARAGADIVPREALAGFAAPHPAGSRALDMAVSRLRRALHVVTAGWDVAPTIRSTRGEGYSLEFQSAARRGGPGGPVSDR